MLFAFMGVIVELVAIFSSRLLPRRSDGRIGLAD